MKLYQQFLTRNDCYLAGRTIRPAGVMIHSTGADNPRLSRYVAPDDGRLGQPSGRHWNQSGVGACVHAFVGRLEDGTVAAYQTLPWTMRGWHCGCSGNDSHISIELCEDDLTDAGYFSAVCRTAVELTARLCREFGLDPLEPGVVICHAEGYKLGMASNHGDVLHWFGRHGKTMDDFRADVAKAAKKEENAVTQEQFDTMLDDYLLRRGALPAGEWAAEGLLMVWAEEGLRQAVGRGISDGTRPQAFATRQEVALMVLAATR